jgi:sec-independent protein translocase protein TatB
MLNIGGWEVLIILLVALLVLGPERLPDAAKQVGRMMSEFRKISSGFQQEMKAAMKDPVKAAGLDVTVDADVPSDPYDRAAKARQLEAETQADTVPDPDNAPDPEEPVDPDSGVDPHPPMSSDR